MPSDSKRMAISRRQALTLVAGVAAFVSGAHDPLLRHAFPDTDGLAAMQAGLNRPDEIPLFARRHVHDAPGGDHGVAGRGGSEFSALLVAPAQTIEKVLQRHVEGQRKLMQCASGVTPPCG
jgi:hypothetical protein